MREGSNDEVSEVVAEADRLLAGGDVRAAISVLTVANRQHQAVDIERALVRARYEGCALLPRPEAPVGGREAITAGPGGEVFEVAAADLTVEAIRTGFAQSGCVLVRGLVSPERSAHLVEGIDATYAAFDAAAAGEDTYDRRWYWPFPMPAAISPANAGAAVVLAPGAPPAKTIGVKAHRRFTREGGGIWTVDSPRLLFELFELVDDLGIGDLITAFLGERALLSANKCNVRRVPAAEMAGGWHQDGAFLGADVGAFNVWIALSRCGVDAPGLDLLPKRFDRLVESGSAEAFFRWSLSDADVHEAGEGMAPVRPEFEAGDALFFDHRLVHRTATSPTMTRERHAIEAWWFSPSVFPPSQLPIVY
jgi:hypothetical protein